MDQQSMNSQTPPASTPPVQAMPAPSTNPTQLMSASVLLETAWAKFKEHYQTYIGIFVIPFLITFIFTAVFGAGASFGHGAAVFGLAGLLMMVVIFLVFVLSQAALLTAIHGHDEKLSVQDAYSRAMPKMTGLLLVSFLTGLFVAAGYVLLIIPGIIFAVWFSFAPIIFIAEGLTGTSAIWKSKEYVKGHWGAVFWRFLFIGVAYMIGSIIIALVAAAFGGRGSLVAPLLSSVYGAVVAPLMVMYQYELYKNLKSVKEHGATPAV